MSLIIEAEYYVTDKHLSMSSPCPLLPAFLIKVFRAHRVFSCTFSSLIPLHRFTLADNYITVPKSNWSPIKSALSNSNTPTDRRILRKMPPKVKDDKASILLRSPGNKSWLTRVFLQTFGMKNKNKSSKVQKHIATVQKQQEQAGKSKSDVRFSVLWLRAKKSFC